MMVVWICIAMRTELVVWGRIDQTNRLCVDGEIWFCRCAKTVATMFCISTSF